jgi:predicted acetyltransferase
MFEVVEAGYEDKVVVAQLLELYQYDFTAYEDFDVDAHGRYGWRYLDFYWTEPDRHPFLLRVDGYWAGLALVRSGRPHDMNEFFVMRKYRRDGIGTAFARELFGRFPGDWQVRQVRANEPAVAFWHRAIPVAFTEGEWAKGPCQWFTIPDSEHSRDRVPG